MTFYRRDNFSWALAIPPNYELSSRPERSEWRDLRLTHPAANMNGSVALPFVIPSEAEGSAVLQARPGNAFRQNTDATGDFNAFVVADQSVVAREEYLGRKHRESATRSRIGQRSCLKLQ